jgi:hypothetical protein
LQRGDGDIFEKFPVVVILWMGVVGYIRRKGGKAIYFRWWGMLTTAGKRPPAMLVVGGRLRAREAQPLFIHLVGFVRCFMEWRPNSIGKTP